MQHKATLEDTLSIMRDLRKRCEWDAVQTHESLRPYLIEEAHELDDALRTSDRSRIREELGDVLLQVVFHCVIAEEAGEFDVGDVAAGLIEKMKQRHPHLYGDGERVPWEKLKARQRSSIDEHLPAGLPSLHRAHRLQDRAAGIGFDWDDVEGPAAKVEEETREVRALLREARGAQHEELESELGDLLFAVVNLCRKANVHPALALDKANTKFVRRFAAMESLAKQRGIDVPTAGLAVLDKLWDEVKASERMSR
ncbi:MAG TPA: nucleoside triphosphate pyrophosphohydrolase [Gemmatimonadaceae bacterium]|nr:nucleoside triphosphate pyrophosphohydrolase [Gemmatimonadaceae bacterium]